MKSIPTGYATVTAIRQAAGVLGNKAFHGSKIKSELPARVDGMRVFNPAFIKPVIQFPVSQNVGAGSFGNPYDICCVIKVAMRNKNVISSNCIDVNGAG